MLQAEKAEEGIGSFGTVETRRLVEVFGKVVGWPICAAPDGGKVTPGLEEKAVVGIVCGGSAAAGTYSVMDYAAIIDPMATAFLFEAQTEINVFAAIAVAFIEAACINKCLPVHEPAGCGGGVIKTAVPTRRCAIIFEVVVAHARQIENDTGVVH